MKPDPQVETKGLQAYEQVRAFERLRTWRLPLVYAVAPVLPAALGLWCWKMGHPALFWGGAAFSALIAVRVGLEWKRLNHRYEENLVLLARLEAEFGDALPWVQVEKHFAQLEALQRELDEERRGAGDGQR
jgi:hypothetical protein